MYMYIPDVVLIESEAICIEHYASLSSMPSHLTYESRVVCRQSVNDPPLILHLCLRLRIHLQGSWERRGEERGGSHDTPH